MTETKVEPTLDETVVENRIYYLVVGKVLARLKDLPEQTYVSEHNTIITGNGEQITPNNLATAQWSLEDNYLKSIPEEMREKVEVYRVIINGITPLGYFTKEEWDSYYKNIN